MSSHQPLSAGGRTEQIQRTQALEDLTARLSSAEEALVILRLRAQSVADVREAEFALRHVRAVIEQLHLWRRPPKD